MKRLSMAEMEAALTGAGIPNEPWTWTEEMRERVETVLSAAAQEKERNPDLPPDKHVCANGHHLLWDLDGKGFRVYRKWQVIPDAVGKLRGRDWREIRWCPLCGGALHVLA